MGRKPLKCTQRINKPMAWKLEPTAPTRRSFLHNEGVEFLNGNGRQIMCYPYRTTPATAARSGGRGTATGVGGGGAARHERRAARRRGPGDSNVEDERSTRQERGKGHGGPLHARRPNIHYEHTKITSTLVLVALRCGWVGNGRGTTTMGGSGKCHGCIAWRSPHPGKGAR